MEWKKMLANPLYGKGFVPRLYKELCAIQKQKDNLKRSKVLQ